MKDLILSISATAVILAAVRLLMPNGKREQLFKYAMGIFLIISIISSVKDVSVDFPKTELTSASVTGDELKLASLRASITALLSDYGICVTEIYFDTDILSDGSININKVNIKTEKREDSKRAAEIIKSQTGLLVEAK